jgi:CheY-like chemotaxis protein/anti-sigma regulatory factor (Ser/Thr protein kinase)
VIRPNSNPTRLRVLGPPPAVDDDRHTSDDPEDDLVSLGARELRHLVASIISSAELLDSGGTVDERVQLYSGMVLRESRRLRALIGSAVALQHLEQGDRELDLAPVDIRSLIQRAVFAAGEDDLRPIAVRAPDKLPLIYAEAEAILEVLGNFLTNARRFSPDGGDIAIIARQSGDMVEIEVEDHGVGIDAETLPKLFRKFFRGDTGVGRLAPGAGLGLAINRRIVEGHGGQIVASSKGLGQGARFLFTLPISQPGSATADVLIVEDDAAYARLLKAELETEGFSTVRAADAETAELLLAYLRPRAIILDLALPGLQGEDFLARMWARGGALPTVVLTMKNLVPSEISALQTKGATAVLPKEAGAPQAAVALIAGALAVIPTAPR